MLSGRVCKIVVVVILVIPLLFHAVSGETPPVHENFEDAEEDLEILLSLLGDSLVLSEETLSFLVNMEFSEENLSIAMEKAQEFHDLLEGAEILLDQMRGDVSSYEYLTEYLTSFQNLDVNMTGLIQFYIYLNENLTIAKDYFEDPGSGNTTADDAVESLNNSESNTEAVKEKVDDIENNTNAINDKGFSTDILEELIIETKQIVESDENTTKELSELFTVIPNFLSIYVYKTEFAIGDELTTYGYFFANGSFTTGQNIIVYMDNQILGEVTANSSGKYEFKTEIPLNHTLGLFEIHASTTYNNSLYVSDTINILVGKIPTILTLSTPFLAYSPDAPVQFSGRLIDYKGRGLVNENITLYFDDPSGNTLNFDNITITNISTDINGNYSFEHNTSEIPMGIYRSRAKFESDEVHIGSRSAMVEVSINIPTNLTLSILKTAVYEGENITFFGKLMDELHNIPLSLMTIEIYIEDEKVGEVVSDNLGRYEYTHSTFKMALGKYNVRSEFNPIELKWRESISDMIEVEIREPEEPATSTQGKSLINIIFDNLFLIMLLILVFLIPTGFYVRKRRHVPTSSDQTQQPERKFVKKPLPEIIITEKLLKETEVLDSKLSSLKGSKNLREVIITGYHALLGILEKNKIIRVKPSHTHLDIAQKLTDKGLPQTEVNSITDIFEKAMYSNRPISSKTIDNFKVSLRKMFAQARGIKA